MCECFVLFKPLNGLILIGVSLSKPHIDRDTSHVVVCMYVCIYVAAGSVCYLNVPENTPIHVAHVHIDNAHCCTKYWTCWIQRMSTKSSTAIKKRLEKLGQLLAQRFKLACCVDRVGAMYYCPCSYAVGVIRPADNAHRREVASA